MQNVVLLTKRYPGCSDDIWGVNDDDRRGEVAEALDLEAGRRGLDEEWPYHSFQPPASLPSGELRQKRFVIEVAEQHGARERARKTFLQKEAFKVPHGDISLVAETLHWTGLRPTEGGDWSINWNGCGWSDGAYLQLRRDQRVNHFPRSIELTRKDRMWFHYQRAREEYGDTLYSFVPETFLLPQQRGQLLECNHHDKRKGWWIVKPKASSRGRGIYVTLGTRLEDDLPEDSVVCRYVANPFLIQGFKFDLRIYALVTCLDPLRVYVYREGLVRFATQPFSVDPADVDDLARHLTNYSLNKHREEFMENVDAGLDNFGHKWSFSALNRHLEILGVDVQKVWNDINEVIMASILMVIPTMGQRARMVLAENQGGCFELFGLDVLLDEHLKPWLLEVNLSPSLVADAPLDRTIKSNLVSDCLNLVGVPVRSQPPGPVQHRPAPSEEVGPLSTLEARLQECSDRQLAMLRGLEKEMNRAHNFIRLYPTATSVQRYKDLIPTGAGIFTPTRMVASLFFPKSKVASITAPAKREAAREEPRDEQLEARLADVVSKAVWSQGLTRSQPARPGAVTRPRVRPQDPLRTLAARPSSASNENKGGKRKADMHLPAATSTPPGVAGGLRTTRTDGLWRDRSSPLLSLQSRELMPRRISSPKRRPGRPRSRLSVLDMEVAPDSKNVPTSAAFAQYLASHGIESLTAMVQDRIKELMTVNKPVDPAVLPELPGIRFGHDGRLRDIEL